LFTLLEGAYVHDLVIVGTIKGGPNSQYVGGVAGKFRSSIIEHCHNHSVITAECHTGAVGGISGEMVGGLIGYCTNNGDITGVSSVGGIVGRALDRDSEARFYDDPDFFSPTSATSATSDPTQKKESNDKKSTNKKPIIYIPPSITPIDILNISKSL